MLYKEDWPQARQRIEAFWEGELLDRVCLAVTAPRDRATAELPEPADDEARFTDVGFLVDFHNAVFQSTFYGGEALPRPTVRLGYVAHGHPQVRFLPTTVWGHPWLPRSSPEVYQFDPGNRWWRRVCEVQAALLEDCRDKYLVGWPSIDPPTDVLSTMRSAGGLCLDIKDRPDEVHEMLAYLTQVRHWMNEQLVPLLLEEFGGLSHGMWGQGRSIALQCDFSIMISAKHFCEFVMPELASLAHWSDRNWYHLDGPGALRHLPAILEIEKLKFVEWRPGAGAPEGLYWQEVWETIREAGKGMQMKVPYDQVEEVIKTWGPRGLYVVTSAPTEEAARDLLRSAERWSCQHPWDVP